MKRSSITSQPFNSIQRSQSRTTTSVTLFVFNQSTNKLLRLMIAPLNSIRTTPLHTTTWAMLCICSTSLKSLFVHIKRPYPSTTSLLSVTSISHRPLMTYSSTKRQLGTTSMPLIWTILMLMPICVLEASMKPFRSMIRLQLPSITSCRSILKARRPSKL